MRRRAALRALAAGADGRGVRAGGEGRGGADLDLDLDLDLELELSAADGTLLLPGSQLVAAVASDLDAGAAPADVSARFHATVAAFTHEALRHLRTRTGVATVALTGGVFQNAVLLEDLADRLSSDGFDVLVHRHVPTNQGRISPGQPIIPSQPQPTYPAAVADGST